MSLLHSLPLIFMKRKLKIVVGTNSLTSTRHQAYSNHCQFWYRLGRSTPHDYIFVNPDRMSIDRMRNMAAEVALGQEADYLLFIDDDVLIPKDSLTRLLTADVDIIAGDVMIRGYPFPHMLFKQDKKGGLKSMQAVPKKRGVIDVDAVGFSLCLIKTSLLSKLTKPYFVTGTHNTEDIYFCLKAKAEVPKVTIKADTSVICSHILWDETISSYNRKYFKRYYEQQNPEDCKQEPRDRGAEYLALVKSSA